MRSPTATRIGCRGETSLAWSGVGSPSRTAETASTGICAVVDAQPADADQGAGTHRIPRLELEPGGGVAQAAGHVEAAGEEAWAPASDGV